MLNRLFHFDELKTDAKTEFMAGSVTFLSMCYIIFVNPAILADAGMPKMATFAATIISTALTTYLMAFYANMPIGLAPGMGINAYFAYTVVLQMGLPWQTALGAVFISGLIFLLLSVSGLRKMIINAVPMNLKLAIGVGVGMFIAMIGFKNSGIIIPSPATIVTLGKLTHPVALLTMFGLAITSIMISKKIKGAILYGIGITTLLGMICGQGPVPHGISEIISFDIPNPAPVFMQLDIWAAIKYGLFTVLFTMTMVDLFDSIGTIIGISRKAGLMDENGNIQNLEKALVTDSCGTMLSGFMGTPAVTSYVESCTGVSIGGKSGFTAFVIATLFLFCLIFSPLTNIIQPYATAPVLIIVGALMSQDITKVKFDDFTDALPAFLTMFTMPITYSIGTGFGIGFISYVVIKACTGRIKELNAIMVVIATCFAISFVMR